MLTTIATFLATIIVPILTSLINHWRVSAQVSDLQNKQNALIGAVAELQAAKTSADQQKAIADIAASQ